MKKILLLLVVVAWIESASAQDYVKIAVAECCDCFNGSSPENQDVMLITCAMKSIVNNSEGLASDLNLTSLNNDQAQKVLMDRMIKYFKKCKSIRKYFKKKMKEDRNSKG